MARTSCVVAALLLAAAVDAATITVNSNADNTTVDGQCTLREAILAANTNATTGDCTAGTPGLDTINFSIGTGAQTINVLTELPGLTGPVSINGTTQPGFAGAPIIEINGSGVSGGATGLIVLPTASSCVIRGLVINNFSFLGIDVLSSNNLIAGNYIGTNVAGTAAAPNFGGIGLNESGGGNTIGGTTAADRNVISGNTGNGITIVDSGSDIVIGNVIGLNAAQTAALPNTGDGVIIFASNNHVGGTAAGQGNVIAGNTLSGVDITGGASGNVVQGNQIGFFVAGAPIGNQQPGVLIESGSGNTVGAATSGGTGGNSFNGNSAGTTIGAGVRVLAGTGNRISTNSMTLNYGSSSTQAPIDLGNDGPTANDNCDGDAGPNALQNFPVLTKAVASGSGTTIFGSLNSTASSTFTIEFFFTIVGTGFLGSGTVTTSAGCTTSFAITVPVAAPVTPFSLVTGTAIDTSNNTSEMSLPVMTAPALTVTKQFTPTTISNGNRSTLTMTITNPGPGNVAALQFTDSYPAGMVTAVGSTSNTCGGTLTATAGGGSFTLSGVALASGASCQVTIPVTTSGPGTFTNTLPAGLISANYTTASPGPFTTNTTNATDVAATLTVNLTPPTVTKAFVPSMQSLNQPVHMSITLANGNPVTITGVSFTDPLPSGMVLGPAVNAANGCGGTLTATAGGNSVVLNNGTIPAFGNCTIGVDVVATATGTLTNTILAGAVTSANAPPNSAPASASLQAVTNIPAIKPLLLVVLLAAMAAIALLRLRG